jgi:MFS family permease
MPDDDSEHQQPASSEEADIDPSHLHSWRLFLVTTCLCLGAVLYGLDMNIIGVAVPVITTQFHSLDDIAWYSAAYLLTITAFQPAFGNVYKYFSAKMVFAGSVVLFESTHLAGMMHNVIIC